MILEFLKLTLNNYIVVPFLNFIAWNCQVMIGNLKVKWWQYPIVVIFGWASVTSLFMTVILFNKDLEPFDDRTD